MLQRNDFYWLIYQNLHNIEWSLTKFIICSICVQLGDACPCRKFCPASGIRKHVLILLLSPKGHCSFLSFWVGQNLKLNRRQTLPGRSFLSLVWNLCWGWNGFCSFPFWLFFEPPGPFTAKSQVHFWPTPEVPKNGILSSQASALNKRTSSINSVTKFTLSLTEKMSLSPKWTEFRKYSRVTTDMFQGWIMCVAVRREAKAWQISLIDLNSFLHDSESLSFDVLAAFNASGESLVMEISFEPGLCKSAQIWLLTH